MRCRRGCRTAGGRIPDSFCGSTSNEIDFAGGRGDTSRVLRIPRPVIAGRHFRHFAAGSSSARPVVRRGVDTVSGHPGAGRSATPARRRRARRWSRRRRWRGRRRRLPRWPRWRCRPRRRWRWHNRPEVRPPTPGRLPEPGPERGSAQVPGMHRAGTGNPVMCSFEYECGGFRSSTLQFDLESSWWNARRAHRPIGEQRPHLRRRAAGATVEVHRGGARGISTASPAVKMPPRTPAACGHTRHDREVRGERTGMCRAAHGDDYGNPPTVGRVGSMTANTVAAHPSTENPWASDGPHFRGPCDPRERPRRPIGRPTSPPRPHSTPGRGHRGSGADASVHPESRCS